MMRGTGVVLLGAVLAGCAAGSQEAAPEELDVPQVAIEAFLEDVTEASQRRDADAVCEHGRSRSLCEQHLSDGVVGPVPASPPTVECRSVTTDGTWVVVRGSTDEGRQYISRLLLVQAGDEVLAQMPVFWDGMGTSPRSPSGESTVSESGERDLRCP